MKGKNLIFLLGLTVISFSMLMFEITLMRISSVTFTYHYSFVAVSLALFGTGVGGAIANVILPQSLDEKIPLSILFSAALSALAIPAATLLSLNTLSGENLVGFFSIMSIPFLFWGGCLSLVFRSYAKQIGPIYAANLIGSALGSMASLFFLEHLGGVNAALLAGAISSVGTLFLTSKITIGPPQQTRLYAPIIGLIVITSSLTYISLNHDSWMVPVGSNPNKELHQYLEDGWEIVDTRWSAFGRTDVVEHSGIDDYKLVFIDGSAGSIMYYIDTNPSHVVGEAARLRNSTAYYPYYFGEKNNILIIGPGAGKDILVAIMGGSEKVTGVEINGRIIDIVEEYSEYNGHIYDGYGNVKIIHDEGRSFLTHSEESYDLIVLTLPVTLTSQGLNGYSLVESFLFTDEAIRDYISHLTEEGRLVVVSHSMSHVYKLVTTILSTPSFQDSDEAMSHFAITAEISQDGSQYRFPVLILKKNSFTFSESEAMYTKALELGFLPLFFPYVNNDGSDLVLSAVESGKIDVDGLISASTYDLTPPSDNKPFFYKVEKNLHQSLLSLMNSSLVVCALTVILPAAYMVLRTSRGPRRRVKRRQEPNLTRLIVYVSLLGVTYVLVEYALIQKFILYLGNPTVANALTLAFLLNSSGLGSLYSDRFNHDSLSRNVPMSLLVAGISSFMYTVLLPFILSSTLGMGFNVRVLISLLTLFPIGFVMGIPFPSSIRLIKDAHQDYLPWLFGVDSVFSVLGMVSAVIVALSYGFSGVLVLGGISYIVAFLVFRGIRLK